MCKSKHKTNADRVEYAPTKQIIWKSDEVSLFFIPGVRHTVGHQPSRHRERRGQTIHVTRLGKNVYTDTLVHLPGHCDLCGILFSDEFPRSSKQPGWCEDCYERYVLRGGRF